MAADTLLVGGDKVHGDEPLLQTEFAVLEYRTDGFGERVSAVVAAETPVLAFNAVGTAAYRANDVFTPTLFADNLTAFLVGVEMGGEFDKRVEFGEVYHEKS